MNRVLRIFCLIAMFPVLFLVILQGFLKFSPETIENWFQKKAFQRAGIDIKTITYGDDVFEYVEAGEGPLLLFVHGFQGDKLSYLSYIKVFLDKKYHVIAFDLPGHGGSSIAKNQKFGIRDLANCIEKFVEAKKLSSFHLVGSSMGGGLCSCYAAEHPEKLLSLCLLNPLGVNFNEKSPFQIAMEKGKNVFFPKTLGELDELYSYLIDKPLHLPYLLKKSMLRRLIKKSPFYKTAFDELITSNPIDDILPKISVKTLVVMGGADKVLPASSFQLFVDKMPNAKMSYLPEGTHMFTGNSFYNAISQMDNFFQNVNDSKNF